MIASYARMCKLLGSAGSGQLTKMVNQICIAGLVEGLSEGIHFAKKAGLDVNAVIETISKGAAQSWQMENRYKTMNEGKFDFGFAVEWMRKDLSICLAEARRNGASLPVDGADRQLLCGSAEDGRQPLGHLEPDRPARALRRLQIHRPQKQKPATRAGFVCLCWLPISGRAPKPIRRRATAGEPAAAAAAAATAAAERHRLDVVLRNCMLEPPPPLPPPLLNRRWVGWNFLTVGVWVVVICCDRQSADARPVDLLDQRPAVALVGKHLIAVVGVVMRPPMPVLPVLPLIPVLPFRTFTSFLTTVPMPVVGEPFPVVHRPARQPCSG